MAKGFIVAIDGTASSGKSTTARQAARELGFLHLDTGAMYRAVTLKTLRDRVEISNEAALEALLENTQVDLQPGPDGNRVLLDGADVTEDIRSPEVDAQVSHVSVIPAVRKRMVAEQRRIARGRDVVTEGRDVTSVVFPDADLKFYMDANLDARAGRRRSELREKGRPMSERTVVDNLTERDYIDSTRAHSPLTRVPDAIYLDTTNLSIAEETAIVVLLVKMRRNAVPA